MFTTSKLPFSFALGVPEGEICTEVATLTGRFSKFPCAGALSTQSPNGITKSACGIVTRRIVEMSCAVVHS